MIKNSFCVAPLFAYQFQYFSTKFVTIFPNSRTTENLSENVLNIIDHNKLFNGSYPAFLREKLTKINNIGHFWSRMPLKKSSDKILLNNNVTHLMDFFFPKNVYNSRIIILFKGFKFFIVGLPVFFLIQIFQCNFLSFENFQSFRKCITWYACYISTSQKKWLKKCKY